MGLHRAASGADGGAGGPGVSLRIELVQLTGSLGLHDCAYRLLDVDDLVTNTAGAELGPLAAPAVAADRLRRAGVPAERVTARRRLLGVVIDAFVVGKVLGEDSVAGRFSSGSDLLTPLALGVPGFAFLVLLPVASGGNHSGPPWSTRS